MEKETELLLTGKCLEAFLNWNKIKKENSAYVNSMLPIYQKALIIDFFLEHRCWDWVFKVELEKTIGFIFCDAVDNTIIKLNESFNNNTIWRI